MATCWQCESFVEDPAAECGFCGAANAGLKPRWVAVLDALPVPGVHVSNFFRWYVLWEIILVALGLLYWPWWASLGAIFIGLLVAAPAAMTSIVLTEQAVWLWRFLRAKLVDPCRRRGLFALEEQIKVRLREDQEAFDTLIGLMNRERRYQDLMPTADVIEYRKYKLLPAFSNLVRLSTSTLLEMEVRRLINQCEQICDGAEDCEHKELNQRYEQLESMQRALGATKNRWNEYLLNSVAKPEFAATAESSDNNGFEIQLPSVPTVLSSEDVARLQRANDTMRQLRQMLHQTQELQLLRAAKPLAGHEICVGHGKSSVSSMFLLLKQIQAPDRLGELEREYQRIVAEQRVLQDTPGYSGAPINGARIGTTSPA